MRWISSKQMAEVDRLAVESYGLGILQMMENAGRNFARFVQDTLRPRKVIVIFGKGNNGGDGLCAARFLKIYGVNVEIVAASLDLNKYAKHQLIILKKMGIVPVKDFKARKGDVVVDSLLGYNIKGNPRGKYKDLINVINFMRKSGMKVVSFDLPSGMNPDTGKAGEPTVKADYTLTLALPKTGLRGRGVGKLYLVNLGIPNELYKGMGIKVGNIFKKGDVVKVK